MSHEYEHEEVCEFKKYAKQTLDLMVDAYKWKIMAKHCDSHEIQHKYMHISDTLMELFMQEHKHMGEMFKSE